MNGSVKNILDVIALKKGYSIGRSGVNDLNDCTDTGLYIYTPASSNRPSASDYGIVFTISTGNTNGVVWYFQLAFSTANNNIYTRCNINLTGWSNWRQIALV